MNFLNGPRRQILSNAPMNTGTLTNSRLQRNSLTNSLLWVFYVPPLTLMVILWTLLPMLPCLQCLNLVNPGSIAALLICLRVVKMSWWAATRSFFHALDTSLRRFDTSNSSPHPSAPATLKPLPLSPHLFYQVLLTTSTADREQALCLLS